MNKGIVVLGVIILIAGFAVSLQSNTVTLPNPDYLSCVQRYAGFSQNQIDYYCSGFAKTLTPTLYPYLIVGGLVALVGFVTAVIGAAIPDRE